ncbi:hypothetical protein HNP46_000404 [Pseudomonas nitritireducens]|uniref:Uncharacterized protein n=1 Tax=Pseudomonas nitroreducens TaxID=46680 RepID=A0A7W7NYD6_PSENT|nr:hypothetical protein [Pseudomonas nitritireducens]MBB4861593.1 hypothetical protein [Pseudomonas nitritireducens]
MTVTCPECGFNHEAHNTAQCIEKLREALAATQDALKVSQGELKAVRSLLDQQQFQLYFNGQTEKPHLNGWWLSLEKGRQDVLHEDKWVLADAAFEAGVIAGINGAERKKLPYSKTAKGKHELDEAMKGLTELQVKIAQKFPAQQRAEGADYLRRGVDVIIKLQDEIPEAEPWAIIHEESSYWIDTCNTKELAMELAQQLGLKVVFAD